MLTDLAVAANNIFYIAYSIDNLKNKYYLGTGFSDLHAAQSALGVAYASLSAAYANLYVYGSFPHKKNTQDAISNAEIAGYSAHGSLPPRKACARSAASAAGFACAARNDQIADKLIIDFQRLKSKAASENWDDKSPVLPKVFDAL